MKTIPLTRGLVALIDDADYAAVSQFKWYAMKRGRQFYAVRTIRKPDGKRTAQYLHQFLMPGVPRIDHLDGNGCNDQQHNLRAATHAQNMQGFQHKRRGTTSKFRGVSWNKPARKWLARIRVCGKDLHLGCFDSEEDAARARDTAALKYFGKNAHLNFPL